MSFTTGVVRSSKKLLFGTLCGLIALNVTVFANDAIAATTQLSVEDAVKHAVEGNLSLKESQITLNASKRASDYSWNSVSPSLDAAGGYSKQNAADDGSLYVRGSVSVAFSPSLFTSIKKAALNYEKGQLDYESAARSIELNVRKSYYALLYEQENINLLTRSVESAKKQYESNLAKYNSGALSQLDVLNAQVTYQNDELSLETAQGTWNSDMSAFKQLLGIPLDSAVSLKGSLQDVLSTPDISIDGVVQKSATISSLQKQIEIAEVGLTAVRFSAYGPTVSASWSYQPSASTADTSTWKDSGSLSLGVSIPLDGWLPWSAGAQNIAAQQDTIASLKLQLEDAKTTVKANTQNYLMKVQQSKASLSLRQKSIELAQKTYDMTLTAYNHGTKDLLSLQTASDNLLQAKVNLMHEAYTLSSAILDLENTIGVPFGTLSK